jgi:adenine-specific DNA-methyltransferase
MLITIAKYDDFMPAGKTGLRSYESSKWCVKNQVSGVFDNLMGKARFKYVFLSYNNEGLMTSDEVRRIMERYGKYDLVQQNYQRFKADKTENRNHKADSTMEYLHVLVKDAA